MLVPVRTIAPTIDLFTTAEAKSYLNVSHGDDDSLIDNARDAAIAHLDGWTGILGACLLTQTWRQDLAYFPASDRIRLHLPPVTSITSITYRDTADASQTLSTAVYAGPFHDELGAYIILKYGQVWPNTYTREDAVAITYVTGYASAAAVPKDIRNAVLWLVAYWYEHRGDEGGPDFNDIPPGFYAMIGKRRRIGI